MRPPVKTKQDFYRRFAEGEFGNCGMNWPTLEEWKKSGYEGHIGIRTKGVGSRCDYNVPAVEVPQRYADFRRRYSVADINLSAMMPDDRLLLQGELTRTYRGLELFGATVRNLPMRSALRDHGQLWTGLTADTMLRRNCDATSYDWLQTLIEEYPDHTIEFSSLEIPWGMLGWNSVVWEVRLY